MKGDAVEPILLMADHFSEKGHPLYGNRPFETFFRHHATPILQAGFPDVMPELADRYATGKGLQQDVLQAQVELSKLLDEKIQLDKRRRTLEDRIN